MPNTLAKNIRWDLSDLYTSLEDTKIFSDLKLAESKARRFESEYKPFFQNKDETADLPLEKLLEAYKEIVTLTAQLGTFAQLSFAEKTDDAPHGAFMQKIQQELTDIQAHLLFFEVEWNKLPDSTILRHLKRLELRPDLHYLEKLRLFAPHTLHEGEEKIMSQKANTGSHAFSRLFDETINNISFSIELNGKVEKKNESEILNFFHSPDRALREKASLSLAGGLEEKSHLLTYIFNMLLADHRTELKIRKFKHPMDPMNLSNEVGLEAVLHLIASVKKAYPLAQRFYELKRRLLGLAELRDYDRYAPLSAEEEKIDFETCKKIVLSGYYEFSKEAGQIAEKFFNEKWIDAEIRPGKQGGGFCCATTPNLHPYILVNYSGSLRDVMTVAHELGHGLHQFLSQKVGILEFHAPLVMAETASVFGEMLIFEKIMKSETSRRKRLELLVGKIDDIFATVFRQIAMTDFELAVHEKGMKEGEIAEPEINKLWIKTNEALYGKSVTLTEAYRHGWKYIPHFIHTPFYCYSYAFAQLFVLCLYETYKADKLHFLPRYWEMLSLGGSKKPSQIAALAGLDLNNPGLWDKGLSLLSNLVKEAETLSIPHGCHSREGGNLP